MNSRIQKILPYLPAAAACLLAAALIWNVLHLGMAAWTTRSVARHIQRLQNLPAPGAESDNPGSNPGGSGGVLRPDGNLPGGGRSSSSPGKGSSSPDGRGGKEDLGAYGEILKRGLFAKIQEQPMPVCTGVLGDMAILNDNLVKVGERAGEWKLVEIAQNKVVLEKDGKRRDVILFPEFGMQPPSEGAPSGEGSSGISSSEGEMSGRRRTSPKSSRAGPSGEEQGRPREDSRSSDTSRVRSGEERTGENLVRNKNSQSGRDKNNARESGPQGFQRVTQEEFRAMSPEEKQSYREKLKEYRDSLKESQGAGEKNKKP